MSKPLDILSLGAGVQSTVLLLMSCRGELPKLDAAIFADTQWEPEEVYTHLKWLQDKANKAGIPLRVVSGGDLRQHAIEGVLRGNRSNGQRYVTLPLYAGTDKGGMVRRQCTREYKIDPIDKHIRSSMLGLKPRQHWPQDVAVRMWFGITSDELRRVRSPVAAWKSHVYPFVGLPKQMLPHSMTRQACIEWLRVNYPVQHIPRSACLGCPFRTNKEWRYIRDTSPVEWDDVVDVDKQIAANNGGECFLHRDRVPLGEANIDEDASQAEFWSHGECLGYCGT